MRHAPRIRLCVRDRVHVLLSIDTAGTDISDLQAVKAGRDYPQAWSNDPVFRAHILGGIRWALGLDN